MLCLPIQAFRKLVIAWLSLSGVKGDMLVRQRQPWRNALSVAWWQIVQLDVVLFWSFSSAMIQNQHSQRTTLIIENGPGTMHTQERLGLAGDMSWSIVSAVDPRNAFLSDTTLRMKQFRRGSSHLGHCRSESLVLLEGSIAKPLPQSS
jgi:hypothetical protein